jgi:hypothetical protein
VRSLAAVVDDSATFDDVERALVIVTGAVRLEPPPAQRHRLRARDGRRRRNWRTRPNTASETVEETKNAPAAGMVCSARFLFS